MIVVGSVLLLVYVGLVATVGRSNRRIAGEQAKSVRLSRAVARAEAANEAKSEFLDNMSHELRTPLNAIIGFSEIIRDEILGPIGTPLYRDYAVDIYDSGSHLLAIVNDILETVSAEAGMISINLGRVEIGDIIHQAERIVQQRALAGRVALAIH